jgi:hypothetical protein
MDNTYLPPDDPQDPWATRPIGYAAPGPQAQAGGPAPGRPGSRRMRWGVGIAAGALLLCGGAAAGVALTNASSAAAGPTGQAAVLNSVLSSASAPASPAADSALTASPVPQTAVGAGHCRHVIARLRAAGRPRAARGLRRACRRRLLRGRAALPGIHGQFTFEAKSGPRTLAYERGVIESVSSAAVVVRAPDGTTWTWDLVSDTVVREHGRHVAKSTLTAGQHVFAGGPVSGGANDARLIVIRSTGGAAGAAS